MNFPVKFPVQRQTGWDSFLPRKRANPPVVAAAIPAVAVVALAIAVFAIGALAIGSLAIGRMAAGRVRIKKLTVDDLNVRRLNGVEQVTPMERDCVGGIQHGKTNIPERRRRRRCSNSVRAENGVVR